MFLKIEIGLCSFNEEVILFQWYRIALKLLTVMPIDFDDVFKIALNAFLH